MSLHLQAIPSKKPTIVVVSVSQSAIDYDKLELHVGVDVKRHFKAEAKEILNLINPVSNCKVVLVGLGEQKDAGKMIPILRSAIHGLKSTEKDTIDILTEGHNDQTILSITAGSVLSTYQIGHFKTINASGQATINIIVNKDQVKFANHGLHIAASQMTVMSLVDHPSNIKTPTYIASTAVKSGKTWGYSVKVYDEPQLKKMGMHALLAVGQGSATPSRLIVMEYKPKGSKSKHPQLGMVGKGISFDTGGVSIKPSLNMGFMKCDMGGAGAVIGAMELAARLQLDLHIVGVVPSAENAVDANSIRPGDVISSYSGKSIEVIDTDAEGRLVLADGLSYIIDKYKPEYLVDLATLTGSIVATLGNVAAGMFTHNDKLASMVSASGDNTTERVWRLPIWDDYTAEMNSDIADVKNLSTRPVAGAITAAKFLEVFVENHPNWVHLDIAGVAFTDSEYAKSRTSTAFGVRLLVSLMESLIANK